MQNKSRILKAKKNKAVCRWHKRHEIFLFLTLKYFKIRLNNFTKIFYLINVRNFSLLNSISISFSKLQKVQRSVRERETHTHNSGQTSFFQSFQSVIRRRRHVLWLPLQVHHHRRHRFPQFLPSFFNFTKP